MKHRISLSSLWRLIASEAFFV